MKISQIPYKRPQKEEFFTKLNELLERFNASKSASEQKKVLEELDEVTKEVFTMGSLSYIRFTLNTNDKFYADEKTFFDEIGALAGVVMQKFSAAMLSSPYRKELFAMFPPVVEKNMILSEKSTNEAVVPLLIKESDLVTQYTQLINNVVVEYKGEKYNLSLMGKFASDNDREVRRTSAEATGKALAEISADLDRLYDELVKVRTEIAKQLGFKNFAELGYYRMGRNCYDKNDIAKFRENVLKYIVPKVSEIKENVRKEMGWDVVNCYDDGIFTKNNPHPYGTVDEIFAAGAEMYKQLSPETSELFNRMVADEAFDVLSKDGKWGGGYCTSLDSYKTPFILANFNGSSHDVEVLTHEFGHALAAEKSFNLGVFTREPTMETCEVHSMSMEFLTYPWMEKFFGDQTKDFKFKHIADSISFIPYGTIVDYFQQLVYENPDMTPAERNELWLKLEKEFKPHMSNDGIPFYSEGRRWQRQMHIYETPFYYIDYCLAQFTAFQFLSLSLKDFDKAFEKYMRFVKAGGTKSFTELLEYSDLLSPFDKEAFIEVCNGISKILG